MDPKIVAPAMAENSSTAEHNAIRNSVLICPQQAVQQQPWGEFVNSVRIDTVKVRSLTEISMGKLAWRRLVYSAGGPRTECEAYEVAVEEGGGLHGNVIFSLSDRP